MTMANEITDSDNILMINRGRQKIWGVHNLWIKKINVSNGKLKLEIEKIKNTPKDYSPKNSDPSPI